VNATEKTESRSKRLLTSREAACYLGISYSYLRTIRMTGKIKDRIGPPPHIHVGKALRYVKEDLDAWIDSQPRANAVTEECEMEISR